jgi:prepilin-type processing-associated H-X9-DG protein
MDSRVRCARNLATFNTLLREYAKVNNYALPSVVYDAAGRPSGYTAFTGADDPNPFAVGSAVKPNDVTASLFLLVREGFVASRGKSGGLSLFVCPSSDDTPEHLTNGHGASVAVRARANFREASHLSYGYSSPFSSAVKYRMNTDWLAAGAAVMADKGPGPVSNAPAVDAPPLDMRRANSANHGGAGQNVLYGDGHVDFQRTPYCGYRDDEGAGDNIYTAAAERPTSGGLTGRPQPGYFGRRYSPAAWGDSYLVPAANDRGE